MGGTATPIPRSCNGWALVVALLYSSPYVPDLNVRSADWSARDAVGTEGLEPSHRTAVAGPLSTGALPLSYVPLRTVRLVTIRPSALPVTASVTHLTVLHTTGRLAYYDPFSVDQLC